MQLPRKNRIANSWRHQNCTKLIFMYPLLSPMHNGNPQLKITITAFNQQYASSHNLSTYIQERMRDNIRKMIDDREIRNERDFNGKKLPRDPKSQTPDDCKKFTMKKKMLNDWQ